MPVSPPRPKMPPLNSLRAFEAAARLNGISAAADELCVTPAAVAQQIKSLEEWTGEKLFKRNAQGVELSPLGAKTVSDFSAAFDALSAAVQKLRMSANPYEIRIAAMPSVAQLWVSPRLPDIRHAMPDVSISVTAMEHPPNLLREPFDLAIFYEENTATSDAIVIGRDTIFPVCSPDIAARLNTIEDLKNEIFLHDTAWKNDWKTWLSGASPDQILTKSGPEFSLYSLALEECKNGAGVLIGHEALVQPLLETETLVAPIKIKVDLPISLVIHAAKPLHESSPLEKVVNMLANAGT
ncbi:MAG: LysR substrate-binding domain-containing protein [Roseibium sp.]